MHIININRYIYNVKKEFHFLRTEKEIFSAPPLLGNGGGVRGLFSVVCDSPLAVKWVEILHIVLHSDAGLYNTGIPRANTKVKRLGTPNV